MRLGCDKWMWICNAQYQHCELCHLSKVALIVLYSVSDQGASVGESVNASGCVWFHHLCLQAMWPSLLIRGLPIKFGPDVGWCVLFGAVYSTYTAGRKRKKQPLKQLPLLLSAKTGAIWIQIRLFCPFSPCLHWPPSYDNSFCRIYQHYLCYWPDWLDPVIKPPHSCWLRFTSVSCLLSPVLSSLSRIVQQHSDDVEETAQHFQSKVKHSHSQTYGAKRVNYWIIVLAILLLHYFLNMQLHFFKKMTI